MRTENYANSDVIMLLSEGVDEFVDLGLERDVLNHEC